MSGTILVLEDDASARGLMVSTLERSGFSVASAESSCEAQRLLERIYPSLILLNRNLPCPDAEDYSLWLANHESAGAIPVIDLVTCEEHDEQRSCPTRNVVDTLSVPFREDDLVVRVKAALEWTPFLDESSLEIDGLKLDRLGQRVSGFGRPIEVSAIGFRMLYFFMRHPERPFTRSQLLDSIWGRNVYAEESLVEEHVHKLRSALAPTGFDRLLRTVNGRKFRLSTRPLPGCPDSPHM